MKLEINSIYSEHGEIFKWKLYTGADGADEFQGECTSLGEVFEKVIMEETRNSFGYYDYEDRFYD